MLQVISGAAASSNSSKKPPVKVMQMARRAPPRTFLSNRIFPTTLPRAICVGIEKKKVPHH
jgi:hypothetical protein